MTELLVLRLVHVLGGIFWVGAGLFTTFFLGPALKEAGPAAGSVMAGLRKRHLLRVMPLVALLTILSGLRLMWLVSGGFAPAWFATTRGAAFGTAGALGLLAFLLGMLLHRPQMARIAEVGRSLAEAGDDAARLTLVQELGRLQRRNEVLTIGLAAMLVLSAAGMAVARYMI